MSFSLPQEEMLPLNQESGPMTLIDPSLGRMLPAYVILLLVFFPLWFTDDVDSGQDTLVAIQLCSHIKQGQL